MTQPASDAADMGADGPVVAKDAYGFTLHYFDEGNNHDYAAIGNTQPFTNTMPSGFTSLYNGNIGAMNMNLPKAGSPLLYAYKYDQLNRLISMNAYNGFNPEDNSWKPIDDYKENISYDANGNIKSYLRNGSGSSLNLNNYSYSYIAGTNKLQSITNSVNGQTKTYGYDAIGNTTIDGMQDVTNATWNVYGKLQSLTNKDGQNVMYTYSADGQRISKKVGTVEEWYVRDASGNVMATYTKDAAINSGHLSTSEFYKYGSSLLDIKNKVIDMQVAQPAGNIQTQVRGDDGYILADQSGNTRATVSDKKIQHSSDGTTVDFYTAEVKNANLYSTYGAISKTFGSTPVVAFNGQRKSTEISASAQTAQFWEYNGDVGRRWNVDPITKDDESSYLSFGGNPIALIDVDGDDWYKDKKGENKGQVIWFEGSGKQKGYRNVGATYNGYTNEGSNKRWMNGDANGKKTLWEDPVVISLKKNGSSKQYNILPNWPTYNKEDGQRWNSYHAMLRDRHSFGQPLVQVSDPDEYKDNFDYYERSWQSYQDWKATNYAILDFASFFVPVPKVGMFRWLKYGGRTFQEAKIAIWAKNTKPIFKALVNEETGQTFKVFAEIHHRYIPQRWGFPNWITNSRFNLQITNSIEHGLIDPFRHQFFPKWIKEGIEEGTISTESIIRLK